MSKIIMLCLLSISLILLLTFYAAAGMTFISDDSIVDSYYSDLKNEKTSAMFTLNNPDNIEKDVDDTLYFTFNEKCGHVTDYDIFVLGSCEKIIYTPIYKDVETCSIDNITMKDVCSIVKTETGQTESVSYYECWKEADNILYGDNKIKIVPKIQMEKCSDGNYGYSIDWIPNYKIDAETIIVNKKWSWWNASYLYKMNINCSELDSTIPFYVNGSAGFTINGKPQFALTYCAGIGMSDYYNNYSDWVIANDTQIIPFIVTFGNVSSYGIMDMPDLISIFPFNENSGLTAEDFISGYNGTIISAAWNDTGIVYSALDFGSKTDQFYVETSDKYSFFQQTGKFAISLWVKYDSYTDTSYKIIASSTTTTSSAQAGFDIDTTGSATGAQIRFVLRNGIGSNIVLLTANDVITSNNVWYHIMVTGDGTSAKLYVNNVLKVNNVFGAFTVLSSAGNLSFGMNTFGTMYPFNGLIDEIMIFNDTLSEDQITQIYNNLHNIDGYGNIYSIEMFTETISIIYPVNNSVISQYNLTDINLTIYSSANFTDCVLMNVTDNITTVNLTSGNNNITYTPQINNTVRITCNVTSSDWSTFHVCIPSWICSVFDTTCTGGFYACLNVTDSNACGLNFTGNIGDYDTNCTTPMLETNICPTETSYMILFIALIVISLTLLFIGYFASIPVLSVIAGLMTFFVSFILAGCHGAIAFILAGVGIVIMVAGFLK